MRHAYVTVAVLLAVAVGCGKLRSRRPCPDFEREVGPLLTEECGACHGASTASGGYRTDSYQAAVAPRPDGTPRLVPGDEASVLVTTLTKAGHPPVAEDDLETLTDWVVCRAPGAALAFHPNGWLNPADELQFHGRALRRAAYSAEECKRCHGADLKGGKAERSCDRCHEQGPFACNVCHGDTASPAPPRSLDGRTAVTTLGVGAHRAHVTDGPLHKAYGCAVCHLDVTAPEQAHHYQVQGLLDPPPAEVRLGPGTTGALARWSHEQATCTEVRCHAPSADDRSATKQTPTWTRVGEQEAACGSCHGLPPSTHAATLRCEGCHPRVASGLTVTSPELHANGVVELGDGTAGCAACHGDASSPAPPRDLQGRSDTSLVGVGAHRAHVFAHTLRGPIACDECHQVPAELRAPGHLDHALPAIVFPPSLEVGVLARADDAQPRWDHATATCSDVYCHGGGASAARDTTPSLRRVPRWTSVDAGVAACGACHGLPPSDGFHQPGLGLGDCAQCHGATIDASGHLRFSSDGGPPSSTHLDGVVQLGRGQ